MPREYPTTQHLLIKYFFLTLLALVVSLFIILISPHKVSSIRMVTALDDTLVPVLDMETITPLEDYTPQYDEVFERIAKCESGNNPEAQNPHSTAGGRFQFIIGSWNYYGEQLWGEELLSKDRFDYDDNTELAWYVYQTVGTSPWNASKHCWGVL